MAKMVLMTDMSAVSFPLAFIYFRIKSFKFSLLYSSFFSMFRITMADYQDVFSQDGELQWNSLN